MFAKKKNCATFLSPVNNILFIKCQKISCDMKKISLNQFKKSEN